MLKPFVLSCAAGALAGAQERGVAVQHDARLQKEEADECRLKDHVREVAKRVAEGERKGGRVDVSRGLRVCSCSGGVKV